MPVQISKEMKKILALEERVAKLEQAAKPAPKKPATKRAPVKKR